MTILIIIIFPFESNQINLDLLSNDAKILKISEICCIASVLNEFKMGHCSKKWSFIVHLANKSLLVM
jgi:hypothetical protein